MFRIIKPKALEIIITEFQSNDPEFVRGLEQRGLTPVVVPDDDPDHNPDNITAKQAQLLAG